LLTRETQLGIFEAGISLPGEMERLKKVVKPTVGIFTNIGPAHQENFSTIEQKVVEKLLLFEDSEILIYCKDHKEINTVLISDSETWRNRLFSWSYKENADLRITEVKRLNVATIITGVFKGASSKIEIPFFDNASVENVIHCWAYLLLNNYSEDVISAKMKLLQPVAMRLELKDGINNCSIINDSYNSDLSSLEIAIDFLLQQKNQTKRTLIISDIFQSGQKEYNLYKEVGRLVSEKQIDRIIGIGEAITRNAGHFNVDRKFFNSTEEFVNKFSSTQFSDEAILIKGARDFHFEKISALLQQKAHNTVLEIELDSITQNLNYYKSLVNPKTRIMVMVKAFSYGSGISEIANLLQFQRVDYLTVAFVDEGIELRNAGIKLPIMVMAPDEAGFDAIIENQLEPEIYSFNILEKFSAILEKNRLKNYPVHIKLDTGMRRLGFDSSDIEGLKKVLLSSNSIKVKSVFSHLAAADEDGSDKFTNQQIDLFTSLSQNIIESLEYPIIRHLLNSAGIERFPIAQFDMVRLGIGLYGISTVNQNSLENISTLKTTIVQIKSVDSKDTIGYNRLGKVKKPSKIATIPIGYADGLSRRLSNGVGKLYINGKLVPIVGNICMDMCMLDVSDVNAKIGDEVIIFGKEYHISNIADQAGTIPYEIFTGISQRVKRVYYHG